VLTRDPGFHYKNDELYCEGVSLASLAEKFATPLYVYSSAAIRGRFALLDRAFRGVQHTLCYSVKANSNLSILRMLARLGAGFDIVSGGELERVRLATRPSLKRVVFSGVGKTAEEIRLALKSGILLFNVESEGELDLLARCAADLRKRADIAFRVNPDVPAETHPYISTGLREHKFGVPISAARRLYQIAAAHHYLRVAGVSLHIGSQITDVAPFRLALERAVELIEQLTGDGHRIHFLDAGGGLGISYNSNQPEDYSELACRYAVAITVPLRKLKRDRRPHLLL
jgi:diaminopimelate decarboxylase